MSALRQNSLAGAAGLLSLLLCGCATRPRPISLLDGRPIEPPRQPSAWEEHDRNFYERTRVLYPEGYYQSRPR